MKHTLRITILVALFCAAAVQSWANPTITKGYIYGGTVKIYAEDPTTNTSQSEITDAAAENLARHTAAAAATYHHSRKEIDKLRAASTTPKRSQLRMWRGTSTRSPCLRAARA